MSLSGFLKILVMLAIFSGGTRAFAVERVTPCPATNEQYFISFQFKGADGGGYGQKIICVTAGSMETADGIDKMTKFLAKVNKAPTVTIFFHKLKS